MSTTVLDALLNAQVNFETLGSMGLSVPNHPIHKIATEQLNNAIKALENGLSANDVIQENMFSDIHTEKTE